MFYDATDGLWRTSDTGLTDIDRTMALWIHMKEVANLVVVGEVPTMTSIQLTAVHGGWNFIGYPSFTQRTLDDVLSSITSSYDAVRTYDSQDSNDPWKNYHIDKPIEMNDLNQMKPGFGYWVHVTEDCTLSIGA
jgi:hypothetical protein